VGAHRPRAGAAFGAAPLSEATGRRLKPPPDRLYGRPRSHALRPRQGRLLAETLPRLRFDAARAADPRTAFAAPVRALWLEVGFGSGEHTLAQAAAHPEFGVIGSEVFENGLAALLSRLVPEGGEATAPLPGNLRIWDEDARVLIRRLPDAALDALFLLFPDPWPKARHAKRRFVHPALLAEIARVLRPGAEWRIATDDPTYQAWVAEVFAAQAFFVASPPVTERPAGWPPTRYEAKARAAGRSPMFWSMTRCASG
jgi:tRNA (guanine-N7-)-methyltransferase